MSRDEFMSNFNRCFWAELVAAKTIVSAVSDGSSGGDAAAAAGGAGDAGAEGEEATTPEAARARLVSGALRAAALRYTAADQTHLVESGLLDCVRGVLSGSRGGEGAAAEAAKPAGVALLQCVLPQLLESGGGTDAAGRALDILVMLAQGTLKCVRPCRLCSDVLV